VKLFLIEAYGSARGGSAHGGNGKIHHFTVRADALENAIALVRCSSAGSDYRHFDLIEESVEFPADEAAIIEDGDGSFLEPRS